MLINNIYNIYLYIVTGPYNNQDVVLNQILNQEIIENDNI